MGCGVRLRLTPAYEIIPFRVQNDKKVVILREAKRSRRIHAAHLHPPPHGFRGFARNDGCLEMEIESNGGVNPALQI